MKTFPLLAFDLDGTLADTEALSLPSAVALMNNHYGVPVTLDYWYAHYHGLAGQALLDAIARDFGVTIDVKEFIAERTRQMPDVFAQGVHPAPGMLQALRNLAVSGQQMCICSNSTPPRINLTLTNLTGQHSAGMNLPNMFEGHIFSAVGDGSGKAKPAPDVYLQAASYYGVTPSQCVAVEDTAVGVQSAVAAGYTCLAYTGVNSHAERDIPKLLAAGAHATFPHWDNFIELLGKITLDGPPRPQA